MSSNGIISFGHPFAYHSPHPFQNDFNNYLVAPFWTDNDITHGVGEVSYQIYGSNQSEALSYISTYISQQEQIRFTGKWMLLAEWKKVPKFHGNAEIVS